VSPVDPTLANQLTQAAQQVIDALDSESAKDGGKIHLLPRRNGGKIELSFAGTAGRVHLVQASTILVDWATIGVAVEHGEGSFRFEDANAPDFRTRFYRLTSP
jgi:hypothetical protein